MHDWRQLIGERVGNLRLCHEAQDEIVRELAAHFEQLYEDERQRGAGEHEALAAALGSVGNWGHFRREIRDAKETLMTTKPWKRQVLYPGMLALVLSGLVTWGFYALRVFFGIPAHEEYLWRTVWFGEATATVFLVPWLLTLPLVGATVAWWARRCGASPAQRLLAACFPAFLNIAIFIVGTMIASVVRMTQGRSLRLVIAGVMLYSLSWIATPAIAAMLGALPFCFGTGTPERGEQVGAAA